MWKPRPSATRLRPIISRKLRHSTTTVGCAFTKRVSGFEARIITPIEMITAAIMTPSSSTMPTAVITASSENTASSTTIWATTAAKLAYTFDSLCVCSTPSRRSCSSMVALNSKKMPPTRRIRSRPEKLKAPSENSGVVSVTSQDTMVSRPRRMPIASDRPSRRALSRWCGGSLSARIAMKIRLSMPRTISSSTSVNRPTQMVGSKSHSMLLPL